MSSTELEIFLFGLSKTHDASRRRDLGQHPNRCLAMSAKALNLAAAVAGNRSCDPVGCYQPDAAAGFVVGSVGFADSVDLVAEPCELHSERLQVAKLNDIDRSQNMTAICGTRESRTPVPTRLSGAPETKPSSRRKVASAPRHGGIFARRVTFLAISFEVNSARVSQIPQLRFEIDSRAQFTEE